MHNYLSSICVLYITYHISYIIYHISYIIYHISHIAYRISYIVYRISYIVYRISYIVYRISYIVYHISYIIYHISYIIYHISYITGGTRGAAISIASLCYMYVQGELSNVSTCSIVVCSGPIQIIFVTYDTVLKYL